MHSNDTVMSLLMKPRGGYVILYICICIHDHDYVMDFHLMVMLHSTTGPYGRHVIDVAYGEMIFHSTEAV